MSNIESIIYTLQHRDRSKDKVVPPRITKAAQSTKMFTLFELILHAVNLIIDSGNIVPEQAKPYLGVLQKHFGFSSIEEASLLCAFFSLCDDSRIRLRDIAHVYKIHTLNIMNHSDELEDLVKRQFIIRRKESDGNTIFRITEEVLQQIRDGEIPHPKDVRGLDVMGFCSEIDDLLDRCRRGEIGSDNLEESFCHLIEVNKHLHIAKTLQKYALDLDDLLLLLVMMSRFINMHDDNVVRSDLEDYFNNNMLRHHAYMLEIGEHTLMDMKLVEHSCCEGQVSASEWKLTEETKQDLLKELNIKTSSRVNLTHYEEICIKKLYYNEKVTKQVQQLQALLKLRRMKQVLERMEKEGMRKGFTCLFYGAPGTGKTETVLQLARQTKRDIMLVDVPNIRSKWVGDTEKNIKRVFDNYRAAVRENPTHAPILVFNEADAVLNKRAEGATGSVDKMENAMQNIILQEVEKLEGIMICTTNLSGSLDPAFERRFLYKIEFENPTVNERQYIWKSMIKGVSKKMAHELAERYDFSGGQIENISRKRLIDDIITGRDTLDMESIIESCENELLNKKQTRRIGFN